MAPNESMAADALTAAGDWAAVERRRGNPIPKIPTMRAATMKAESHCWRLGH
jgi:hypothetical protein